VSGGGRGRGGRHGYGAGRGRVRGARYGGGAGRGRGARGERRRWRVAGGQVTESERRGRRRKEKRWPVYFTSLPSARDLALVKVFFNFKIFFAECQISGTRQRSVLYSLPSVNHLTLGKESLYRVSYSTLGKAYFYFFLCWQPNFVWYVPTLCRPTCTILGQL
jgi:hypothetical protein